MSLAINIVWDAEQFTEAFKCLGGLTGKLIETFEAEHLRLTQPHHGCSHSHEGGDILADSDAATSRAVVSYTYRYSLATG